MVSEQAIQAIVVRRYRTQTLFALVGPAARLSSCSSAPTTLHASTNRIRWRRKLTSDVVSLNGHWGTLIRSGDRRHRRRGRTCRPRRKRRTGGEEEDRAVGAELPAIPPPARRARRPRRATPGQDREDARDSRSVARSPARNSLVKRTCQEPEPARTGARRLGVAGKDVAVEPVMDAVVVPSPKPGDGRDGRRFG